MMSQVLFLAVKTLKDSGHEHVYNAVEKPLQLAQTAAVLEILHGLVGGYPFSFSFSFVFVYYYHALGVFKICLLSCNDEGLVRSPITATLPQIGSRLYLTWVILHSVPEIRSHFLVTSLVISWSITEASIMSKSIRYSFFGMKEVLGFAPSWLMWLRYSTFLLLYPTGISSEVGLIYFALPYIKESDKYCIRMPNKWNFSFDNFYAAILALGIYIPGKNLVDFTQLSSHHFDI
ncbi:hypothetical protein SADUNF_Sadunf07G0009600 [Salix dunnii]|uniref:Very-long-chain (3R)-3-hydroxyacyl-CoA dehydratase n=1 Tax=Salix dunnii TaxID=1413687 RepID=A0A835JY74_9ROSI|nr:hypothetical protein SADUNF_Sadunf07G0009600 [Salix dunnii]